MMVCARRCSHGPGLVEAASRLLRASLAASLARAGLLLMVFTDLAAVARTDMFELARFGLGLVPFTVLLLVGTGLLSGTSVLVSRARGGARPADGDRIWRAAALTALGFGSAALLLAPLTEPLLRLFGQTPELARGAAPVAAGLAPGLPALLLFLVCQLHLEACGRARAGFAIVALGVLANALLDLPWAGATDAVAVAGTTTLVRLGMAAAAFAAVLSRIPLGSLLDRPRHTLGDVRRLLRLGLPWAAAQSLETLAFHTLVLLAGTLGMAALSAYHIAAYLLALVYCFAIGTGTATAIEVGRAVGAGQPPHAARAALLGVGTGCLFAGGFALVLFLLPSTVARLLTVDPEVAALLASCLPVLGLVLLVDAVMGVLATVLRGFGDRWPATWLHAVGLWAILVPAALLGCSVLGGGLHGILWALVLGLVSLDLLLAHRLQVLLRRSGPRPPALAARARALPGGAVALTVRDLGAT